MCWPDSVCSSFVGWQRRSYGKFDTHDKLGADTPFVRISLTIVQAPPIEPGATSTRRYLSVANKIQNTITAKAVLRKRHARVFIVELTKTTQY